MEYLYHRVPKNMSGTVLYPLNSLKDSHPEVYAEHVKKYEGRERLLTLEIPALKCLWNDVLHFTAVSPKEVKENMAKADIYPGPFSWFKIPVEMVVGDKSTAFMYRTDKYAVSDPTQYETFDPGKMGEYRKVPPETIEYYKQKKSEGTKPLLFHLVPHILYKGTIETNGLEIVTI